MKEDEIPIPVSPVLGPIRYIYPSMNQTYKWCSCGMSDKQPFCDGSHENTAFSPLKFRIHEKVREINLCGCKLSSKKPFCDGETCSKIRQKENN